MRFPLNFNIDWSTTPEFLELEILNYEDEADFYRLSQAIFGELDKELLKANKDRRAIASDAELVQVVKLAVGSYQPKPALTLFIYAYLRVREHLLLRIRS